MEGTMKCSANYVPLTPISFLERSAVVYGDKISVVYGDVKYTWKQTHQRCIKLASALSQLGIFPGDVVSLSCAWILAESIIVGPPSSLEIVKSLSVQVKRDLDRTECLNKESLYDLGASCIVTSSCGVSLNFTLLEVAEASSVVRLSSIRTSCGVSLNFTLLEVAEASSVVRLSSIRTFFRRDILLTGVNP